jgi:hypothetical protein
VAKFRSPLPWSIIGHNALYDLRKIAHEEQEGKLNIACMGLDHGSFGRLSGRT